MHISVLLGTFHLMSIAFDKRDYNYIENFSDEENEHQEDEDEPEQRRFVHHRDNCPSKKVITLERKMTKYCQYHAIEVLDKCDPVALSHFLSQYDTDFAHD